MTSACLRSGFTRYALHVPAVVFSVPSVELRLDRRRSVVFKVCTWLGCPIPLHGF